MWTLYNKDSEHWIPLSTVASFKRMRDYAAKGLPWLASTIKASSTELEMDESNTNVRRTKELPKEPKGQFERSVYAVRLFAYRDLLCPHISSIAIERTR